MACSEGACWQGSSGFFHCAAKLRVQGCGGKAEGAKPQSVLAEPGGAVPVGCYATAAYHVPGLGSRIEGEAICT